MSIKMDDHVGLIIQLARRIEELASRLEAIEHKVNERIVISCPVEGCSATFTTKGHRNRHVKDWVRKKAEHEPLWKEHKRALNDDQNSDSDPNDDPQGEQPALVLRSASITPPSRGGASGVRDAARDAARDVCHTQQHDMLHRLHYPATSEVEFTTRSGDLRDTQMNSSMDVDGMDPEEGNRTSSQIPFGFEKYWSDIILDSFLRSTQGQTGGQS
ncbi:hypothetical protein F4775DRAFT_461011 [Biscogniauxia sp. FL1348]|nr:hypothetical protein F4775DRAFT_461011 [Biscogniauxia sp. FL1348]